MTSPTVPQDASTAPDPAAPYGRRSDGTPARKRGPKGPRAGSKAPAPRRRSSSTKPKPADYKPAVTEILTLVGAGVGLLPGEVWKADGAALQMWAPGLADGTNELAGLYPEFAALLDKVVMAGPALKIAKPLSGLALQLATNHGLLPAPAAVQLGAVPKEMLLAELRRRGEEIAAQTEAEAAHQQEILDELRREQQPGIYSTDDDGNHTPMRPSENLTWSGVA